MSTIELKEKLINKIHATEDKAILSEAYRLIALETEEDDTIFVLNEDQKAAVFEARKQIANGEYMTAEEADREIEQWLKK